MHKHRARPKRKWMKEDQHLLVQLHHGNRDAVRQLYEKYKDSLFTLAVAVSGDRHLAEDALQDVFVTLAMRAREIRIRNNLKGYLASMMVNRIRTLMREVKPVPEMLSHSVDERIFKTTSDTQMIASEELEIVYGTLRKLPTEQAEVIWLHLHAELTFREIARTNDLSIATVHSRYRYGLQKMRVLLDGQMEIGT